MGEHAKPEQLEHETVNCPLSAWIILQRHKGITPEQRERGLNFAKRMKRAQLSYLRDICSAIEQQA